MPKISIIMPVYNPPLELFQKCLSSIQHSSYTNFECLMIDDGSSNGCESIAKTFQDNDERFILKQYSHLGVSHARNAGISAISGDYFTFVDSDDQVTPSFLNEVVNCIKKVPADIYFGGISNGKITKEIYQQNHPNDISVFEGEQLDLFRRYVCSSRKPYELKDIPNIQPSKIAAKVYKKDVISNVKFDPHLTAWEDGLFNASVCMHAQRIVAVNSIWYQYNKVSSSISHSLTKEEVISNVKALKAYVDQGKTFNWRTSDIVMRLYTAVTNMIYGNVSGYSFKETVSLFRYALKCIDRWVDKRALNPDNYILEKADKFLLPSFLHGSSFGLGILTYLRSAYKAVRD